MVFKSLDGYFDGIMEMNIWGDKLLRGIYLKEGLLEEITSFIFHYLELGIFPAVVSVSRNSWTPLLMHAPDMDGRASVKMALLS